MKRNQREAEIRLRMVKDDLRVIAAREERLAQEKQALLLKLVVLRDALKVTKER